ncbi:class I SAM-dependent methyltransferase [Bacillus salinus]|uniref:class I SAM-dependent methyltransferase n=1 Tax=Bacillus sp. HMF5848 TaxID=2495421 RepID=UPI00163A13A8|nr:class I SAM-dependent methyltransferase [Bacillus sp. HMF5848]
MTVERIKLEKEKETLLITFYSKVLETQKKNPILVDEEAVKLMQRIEYDYSLLKVPKKTQITVCIRAKLMDDYVSEFLLKHPQGTVINMGCGLDTRFFRVDNGAVKWFDLDFPEVMELKSKFFPETDRYRHISSSVTDWTWLEQIQIEGKVMVVAEGLLMYVQENEVKILFEKLQHKLPGSQFVFDVFSSMTVNKINRHPSIKKTGANLYWGIDDAKEIERWGDNFAFIEERYFAESKDVSKLSFGYRMGFKVAGLFPVANKAHRIVLYQL